MKVGIIGFTNLYGMPYLNVYASILKKENIDFEVVYWNRDSQAEPSDFKVIAFNKRMVPNSSKSSKIINYALYSNFIKSVVKKNKYDFLVILTTVPAVFLSLFLREFKNRYIVDIRDYSFEHVRFFKALMDLSLKNSAFNVISSPGFYELVKEKFRSKTYLCNNISYDLNKHTGNKTTTLGKAKVVIGFVGAIRYYDECVKLIEEIRNDSRFEFSFYGGGLVGERLALYCKSNNINNVFFNGRFTPSQKAEIYSNIDIIFNLYGNKTKGVKLALSNRFYDAAWYRKPILVNENTFMSKYSTGISYTVIDNELELGNKIWNWYQTINWDDFNIRSEQIIQNAVGENKQFEEKLLSLVLKESNT
jgi:hypothetical protein